MDWLQIFSIFLGNIAIVLPLWLWSRSENRTDMREMREEFNAFRNAMLNETKDFHGRLLILEERYLKLREDK